MCKFSNFLDIRFGMKKLLIVTGSIGFIGSNLIWKLNEMGFENIVAVDDFDRKTDKKNLDGKNIQDCIDREKFFEWLQHNKKKVEFIFHIGARTDTAEFDKSVFDKLNLNYSKEIWKNCVENNVPLIYASSAATYGMGEFGYSDNHEIIEKLKPLNPYGESKNEFDKWVLQQKNAPPFWAGLKFFNVYGPNEFHKNRMASVIFHAFHQIKKSGEMKLFRSHIQDFKDGEQKRDFIYVKDVADVIYFLFDKRKNSGIYNLGTGKARTFKDLVKNTFEAMSCDIKISFIDTPKDIREKYQYFTEAKMEKLRDIGYKKSFFSLEKGIDDYVKNYLINKQYV